VGDPGIDHGLLRHQILHDASLAILPGEIRLRQGKALVVDWQRYPTVRSAAAPVPESLGG